jgi:hypothetical protein
MNTYCILCVKNQILCYLFCCSIFPAFAIGNFLLSFCSFNIYLYHSVLFKHSVFSETRISNLKLFQICPLSLCQLAHISIWCITHHCGLFCFDFYLLYQGLNSRPTPWTTLPALFVLGIVKLGPGELLPRLASNCDPPDLCLLSSWVTLYLPNFLTEQDVPGSSCIPYPNPWISHFSKEAQFLPSESHIRD